MRCAAITRAGERCRLEATEGSYCWNHSPEHAQARKIRARRGGKSGGNGRAGGGEIIALKERARELYREVHKGTVEPGPGAVLTQIINAQARLLELERKIKETEQLEQRVERLEEAYGVQGGAHARWGV